MSRFPSNLHTFERSIRWIVLVAFISACGGGADSKTPSAIGGSASLGGGGASSGGREGALGGAMMGGGGASASGGATTSSGGNLVATGGTPQDGAGGSPMGAGGRIIDGPGPGGPIFVSPEGDDTNPGTQAYPFKTLSKARDVVRTMTDAMTDDIVVYLRGGTYVLSETLELTSEDSGKNGFDVKYLAFEDERPLLTGGALVSGFQLTDPGKNIYTVENVSTRFRQLYVDGKKAIRARSPNLGPNGAANFSRIKGADTNAHNVQIDASAVANWNNLTHVELHLMLAWAENVLRVASISTNGGTALVKVQKPEDDILYARPYPGITQWSENAKCYYFENALEFLDQPGEWYLDEATNVLSYMPLPDQNMGSAQVVVPLTETLLSVKGSSTSDQVSHIWFEGLTFAHTTYMKPSEAGFLDGQAGQYNVAATPDNDQYVARPASGVVVQNANHIHFERNMFTQMAATGLDFVSGTHDDVIVGNVFRDIGGSGISVGKFTENEETEFHVPYYPADEREICTNELVSNNFITNATTEILGGCGIAAGYPRYITIEHNEVSELNYTGISVGFGWTTQQNAMSDNKIDYNHVHHIGKVLADGAAIYTLSNQGPDSSMQYNYVHDFQQSEWADYQMPALYLDEGTAGYTVAHNVMINTPGWIAQNRTGTNTLVDNGTNPSGAQDTMKKAGLEPEYEDIKQMAVPAPSF